MQALQSSAEPSTVSAMQGWAGAVIANLKTSRLKCQSPGTWGCRATIAWALKAMSGLGLGLILGFHTSSLTRMRYSKVESSQRSHEPCSRMASSCFRLRSKIATRRATAWMTSATWRMACTKLEMMIQNVGAEQTLQLEGGIAITKPCLGMSVGIWSYESLRHTPACARMAVGLQA